MLLFQIEIRKVRIERWRWRDYHKRSRGDVREEVDRNAPADEDCCGQAGKAFAAATTGWMGPGIVANHHASLLQVRKTLLKVATETLSRKTDDAKEVERKAKLNDVFWLKCKNGCKWSGVSCPCAANLNLVACKLCSQRAWESALLPVPVDRSLLCTPLLVCDLTISTLATNSPVLSGWLWGHSCGRRLHPWQLSDLLCQTPFWRRNISSEPQHLLLLPAPALLTPS